MAFDREQIKKKVAALAAKGVYILTPSWDYEYGRKVVTARFERDCLSE